MPQRILPGTGKIVYEIDGDPGVNYRPISSFPRYAAGDDGSIWSVNRGIRIKPAIVGRGYYCVGVSRFDGTRCVRRYVHCLVLETFKGPKENPDYTCRHLDGNKQNNCPANLCWGTALEQSADNERLGVNNKGSRNGMSKLTEEDVREINADVWAGGFRKRLAARYGVTLATIDRVVSAATWQHVARKPKRGRTFRRGGDHHNAKLTDLVVVEIIERAGRGEKRSKLAREFGVTSGLIGHITHGRAWKHIPRSNCNAVLAAQGFPSSRPPRDSS